jgi:hypothetical protein
MLETYTPYDNMYWIIDLENFYIKCSNIDLELKNINNNILLSLYSNFNSNKKDAIHILNKQLKQLTEIDKSIVNYSELENRMNNIINKINREKNINKREDQMSIYKPQMNSIYNSYMLELMRWNNYFSLTIAWFKNMPSEERIAVKGEAAEIISSMASPGVGTLPNSGKPMSPIPSTPCTNCAVSNVRNRGWAAPT